MTEFTRYDTNGRVLVTGSVPEAMIELQGGLIVHGKIDGRTHYVFEGTATPRPQNPATLSGADLSGLPAPCQIIINGVVYECEEATATLDFTYPGNYDVRVSAFPYLDAVFEVTT